MGKKVKGLKASPSPSKGGVVLLHYPFDVYLFSFSFNYIVYLNIPSLGGAWGGSLNSLRLHLMTSNQALLYMHPVL